MLYKKGNQVVTRASAISNIIGQLNSVVEPAYIGDDILALYGFILEPELEQAPIPAPTKEERKLNLENVDWVVGASQLSAQTKSSVESWRWLVRNLPQIDPKASIPPLPKLKTIPNYFTSATLTENEVEQVKNYVTSDNEWLTFLQVWKDLGFTNLKYVITNLLSCYTDVKLDEIIGSI